MNMSKRRRIGSSLPELPEAMIQHIQSYMSGKEAARTTLLSKSWHTAWLTRPSLDFDTSDFKYGFEQFTTKAMRRYQKLGFKIESFSLRSRHSCNFKIKKDLCRKLIIEAMKIGATDLQIQVHIPYLSFSLPKQVLGSQTLVKLSLAQCIVDGKYVISCPTLKSLTFNRVTITKDNVFCNILTSCKASIEELFLCDLFHSSFTVMSCSCELQKLKRLFLCNVEVNVTIFSNDHFASRFPCLEELSILECRGCTNIHIASPSLQTISFRPRRHWRRNEPWTAKFDVPNIRKFTHSAWGSPVSKLSIKAEASREWEFDLSITCNQLYKTSWFLNLKKYLAKYRLSRISIFVNIVKTDYYRRQLPEVEIELAPKPLVDD